LKGKNAGLQKKKCEDFASVDSFGRYEKWRFCICENVTSDVKGPI
jgi:hypothetical protein